MPANVYLYPKFMIDLNLSDRLRRLSFPNLNTLIELQGGGGGGDIVLA
ncbi:hypothetical protein [Candidatus Endomicrobiellum trichonymphae]|nr:hypothetical protein [Candidatus Endomicrobium trichonymphae]